MATSTEKEYYMTLENFDPKNYEKESSFFIIIAKYKKFLKNILPQKDLVENNKLPDLIIQKIKSLFPEDNKSTTINILK